MIWKEFQPLVQAEYDKKMQRYEQNETERLNRIAIGQATEDDKKPFKKPTLRMHADDPENFLKLASCLKIILGRSIRKSDLPRARRLLHEYLTGFLKVSTYIFFLLYFYPILTFQTNSAAQNQHKTESPLGYSCF